MAHALLPADVNHQLMATVRPLAHSQVVEANRTNFIHANKAVCASHLTRSASGQGTAVGWAFPRTMSIKNAGEFMDLEPLDRQSYLDKHGRRDVQAFFQPLWMPDRGA